MGGRALTVAIVNDYEIVVAGVAAALGPYRHRVEVVEAAAGVAVRSDVDLILYDTFGQVQGDGVDLADLVRDGDAKVVVFSWNVDRDLVERSLARGAAGYVAKSLPADELVAALEAVARGERVRPGPHDDGPSRAGTWPGREGGLSEREAEVVALIVQGLSNEEIAQTTFLSINSVKTYVRTAYRKIGVSRRSQAVIWGMGHGFQPDRVRLRSGSRTDGGGGRARTGPASSYPAGPIPF